LAVVQQKPNQTKPNQTKAKQSKSSTTKQTKHARETELNVAKRMQDFAHTKHTISTLPPPHPPQTERYADKLEQLETGRRISPNPKDWRCDDTGATENLWLNLSTGHVGSGRQVGADAAVMAWLLLVMGMVACLWWLWLVFVGGRKAAPNRNPRPPAPGRTGTAAAATARRCATLRSRGGSTPSW
jgi:hypothetical protein